MIKPSGNPFARGRKPEEGLLERPSAPCRADVQDLLAIADTLTAANAKLGMKLDGWRQKVNALQSGQMADDLATEWRLEELAMNFRRQWIELAHSAVAGEMRSSPIDHITLLPIKSSINFIYERVIGAGKIEGKLKAAATDIPGWERDLILFGSGMAAITAAITVLRYKQECFRTAEAQTLNLDMFGGYFETLYLLDLLNSSDLCCRSFQDPEPLLGRFSAGETDILFLELIAYDWKQTVLDPARLLEALALRSVTRPWVLMLDTTLLGPMFQLGPLLAACGKRKPVLVLEIRSGLKLDQVGLEFSNVGIIKTVTPKDLDTTRYLDAKRFKRSLSHARKRLGNALSLSQIAILDAPWIFDPERTQQHTKSVLDNNRRLAFALSGIQGLFSRVSHPGLGPQSGLSWAESPIVVMEFHASDENEENSKFLLAVIAHEVRRRKIILHIGASFGFRHHRCEVIEQENPTYSYPDGRPRQFFKVAMGSYSGPSLAGTIELMQELAAFSDFRSLHLAYPKVKPAQELAVFPDFDALYKIR